MVILATLVLMLFGLAIRNLRNTVTLIIDEAANLRHEVADLRNTKHEYALWREALLENAIGDRCTPPVTRLWVKWCKDRREN